MPRRGRPPRLDEHRRDLAGGSQRYPAAPRLAVDADADLHLVVAELEGRLAGRRHGAAGEGHPHAADVVLDALRESGHRREGDEEGSALHGAAFRQVPGTLTGSPLGIRNHRLLEPLQRAEQIMGVGVGDELLVSDGVPRVQHREPGQEPHGSAVGARRGVVITVVSQCAEITRTARGRGSAAPSLPRYSACAFPPRAFMGEPWPIKRTGIS